MNNHYICPNCKENLVKAKSNLQCHNGHSFSFAENTNIPIFACEDTDANEYNVKDAVQIHDNALKWLFATFGGTEESLRNLLISKLHLQKGQRILITGVGAGNDLPYIAKLVGKDGEIFAQDFSSHMLLAAKERCETIYSLKDHKVFFSVSDATMLPYSDNFFDAVYHFGGLNIFSDIAKGISEMDRVVKSGGKVVFGDEGIPPWLKNTEYGKMVINNNPLCAFDAPLEFLPQTARNVNVSWAVGYCFYIIDYTASTAELPINIDVEHVGTRGGSMRTRYYGQLEGINPQLKDALYTEAKKRGISRVQLLENIITNSLKSS